MRNIWPTAQALSEFWGFHDTCGPDAVLMGMHVLSGNTLSGPAVDAVRAEMISLGLFAPGGCTLSELKNYVIDKGYAVNAYAPYGSSVEGQIHPLLKTFSGPPYALVIQVIAAHNLPNNEGGVNSHFIAGLGIDSILGYYCGNGDDVMALNANNGHGKIIPMRWYTWNNLLNAQIMGAFAFSKGQVPVSGVPAGWTDDGTTLSAPNGHKVVLGFRLYVLSHTWDPLDYPLEEEYGTNPVENSDPSSGAGTRQTFQYSRLGYTTAQGVFRIPVGAELVADGK